MKSKDGNRYAQLFANVYYFATIYPMDSKGKAGDARRTFGRDLESLRNSLSMDHSSRHGRRQSSCGLVTTNAIDLKISAPIFHNEGLDPFQSLVFWYFLLEFFHVS